MICTLKRAYGGLASGFWQGWLSAVVDSHGCFVACDFWLSSLDAFILFGTVFTGIFAVSFYFMLFWGFLTISSGLSGRKPTAD